MWFLQADILVRMLVASVFLCVLSVVCNKFNKSGITKYCLLLADVLLLMYVSKPLCVFYVCYTFFTYLMVKVLGKLKTRKKVFFVLFCIISSGAFVYAKFSAIYEQLPVLFALVGISYNMLKAIDALYYVYYTDMPVPFLTYSNYMLFFPVITSGPIFRYRDFENTFNNPQKVSSRLVEDSVKRLIKGMFKKMVALYFVTKVMTHLVSLDLVWYMSLIILVLSYMTVYLDLSGYSDMSIALGSVFGIKVPENFKKPWTSVSFTVFWRNWHISLSDWIREHVYVVLSKKKLNKYISAVVAFFTMIVMALWHGFSLPYILSGIYNGILLAFENLTGLSRTDRKKKKKFLYFVRCFVVSFLFSINTMFYVLPLEQMVKVLKGLVSF